jgi:hypothetical protein
LRKHVKKMIIQVSELFKKSYRFDLCILPSIFASCNIDVPISFSRSAGLGISYHIISYHIISDHVISYHIWNLKA